MTRAADALDDRGTTPEQGRDILREFCEEGFESMSEAALVLGRSEDEISEIIEGTKMMDDSLLMKVRGIAAEREIEIETVQGVENS